MCVCLHDGELPEEHLEQSVNLINFPQKSNHHNRQICEKYKGTFTFSVPFSRSWVCKRPLTEVCYGMETNRETQEEVFASSSNRCPIWDDLNVLNHGANVDGLY